MVTRMMRWRPWPPLTARKFQVRLVVRGVEGMVAEEAARAAGDGPAKVVLEVRWKGPKATLSSLRRSVKRNRTREEQVGEGGDVVWNEEFETVCTVTSYRENAFAPWEVAFAVFSGLNQGPKNKETVVGMASLNLAEFMSTTEDEVEINIPLLVPDNTSDSHPTLHLTLSSLEIRTSQESSDTMQKAASPSPLSPSSGDLPPEKDELSAIKAGLRKVKILTDFVSTRKSRKACRDDDGSDGKCSGGSDDAEYTYPFDTDSHDGDDIDEGETEDNKEHNSIRKSFSYGTLASANFFGGSLYSDMKMDGEYEDCVYYSHRRSDVGCSHVEETSSTVPEEFVPRAPKRSILPWKKRKLSFRSPKAKGEPLLKKAYGEEGGDDIDYDRRLMSSSDESLTGRARGDDDSSGSRLSVSEFGDDNFVVGTWESRELLNRDGQLKLLTQVFFASIDQRSERAAGESACTALVAVIADWFQKNQNMMPIKSQFDGLIREGSYEWRSLCENQKYRELFPDKHFDLDTVLQAKIRRLTDVPSRSFIGFFHPEDSHNDSGFDVLHGAMSFDCIWDEISRAGAECTSDTSPHIYIVSWNDHFFVLKVDRDAYYIIDTLGERLYEGCNQAYILKFDESTAIYKLPNEGKPAKSENSSPGRAVQDGSTKDPDKGNCAVEENVVCRGKESCREYIKNFLAAIPIRELQEDIKKGRMSSALLHRRLQIEFHYTDSSEVENLVAVTLATDPAPEASCPVEQVMQLHPSPAIAVA